MLTRRYLRGEGRQILLSLQGEGDILTMSEKVATV